MPRHMGAVESTGETDVAGASVRQDWPGRVPGSRFTGMTGSPAKATVRHTYVAALDPGTAEAFQACAEDLSERIIPRSIGAEDALGPVLNATIAHEAHVPIRSSADIVVARQHGRALASLIGFSSSNLTMIATAISEMARNIVEYAREGEVTITLINSGNKRGVKIVASDQGPGIADIAAVMRDGFSTGQGLGIGLPGARRLMDEFEIASEIDKGTTVVLKKWL